MEPRAVSLALGGHERQRLGGRSAGQRRRAVPDRRGSRSHRRGRVFETAKLVDGHPFALTRHLARLDLSLAGLGLPSVDHDHIRDGVKAVLDAAEPIAFGRLRITVTAGVGPLGSERSDSDPTYIVTSVAQARPAASGRITVVPWTRNERAATVGLKTTSYADNVIAIAAARQVGAMEAVFANTRGELCECTGSNIFVVVDGVALTPPGDCGLLRGITRGLVLEWGADAGIVIREQTLPLDVLTSADEVFLTSSIKDVFPVHAIDDRELAVGPVTTALAEVFAARSTEDLDP